MSSVLEKKKGLSCVYLKINGVSLKFLVDSGASISLIKFSKLPKFANIFQINRMTLYGVNGKNDNRGLVHLDVCVNEFKKEQRFCVIDEIKCDVNGILGGDFMRDIGGQIDFMND